MRASGVAFVFVNVRNGFKDFLPCRNRPSLRLGRESSQAWLREGITNLLQQLVPGNVGVEGVLEQVLPRRGQDPQSHRGQLRLCVQED